MYADGNGATKIINTLNSKNIVSPSKYYNYKTKSSNIKWNEVTVRNILKSQIYIGNTVQNKKNKLSYKSKKEYRLPKEKWIIVENTHEPIVSKEIFYNVQEIMKKNTTSRDNKFDYLFKKFIYCHHCKCRLQICLDKKSGHSYIHCTDYIKRNCYSQSLRYSIFEEKVIEAIKQVCYQYSNNLNFAEIYQDYKNKEKGKIKDLKKDAIKLNLEISDIENKIEEIYLDKLNKVIDENTYTKFVMKFSERKSLLYKEIKKIENSISDILNNKDIAVDEEYINNLIKSFLNSTAVNKNNLYKLIDRIEIDKNKNVYISFNFKSLNIINENGKILK